MPVTQKDIAEKLGISRRLVGYALEGHPRVSAQTRQAVLEAAESLGYQPNRLAQALTTGKTYQVCLCFPLLGGTFYSEIIRRVEEQVRSTPYDLLISTFDPYNPKQHSKVFPVDGMIFVGPAFVAPPVADYPIVVLETQMRRSPETNEKRSDTVEMEIRTACREAMQHLLSQGFKRIAYVATRHMMQEDELRYISYCEAMQNAGLPLETVMLPIHGETQLRKQTQQLLKTYFEENGFPEALFCSNDDEANGAYRALRDLKRNIPEDTAVMGFDDFDDAEYMVPPLTSIHLPLETACRRVFEMLMERLEDRKFAPRHETYSAHLVIRESTRRTLKTD